jgi:hypothetical protein
MVFFGVPIRVAIGPIGMEPVWFGINSTSFSEQPANSAKRMFSVNMIVEIVGLFAAQACLDYQNQLKHILQKHTEKLFTFAENSHFHDQAQKSA